MAGGCSAGCGSCCVVCCNVMNVKLCLKYLISIYGAVRVLGPGVSSYKGYLLWVSGGTAVNLTQVPALLVISLTVEIRSEVILKKSSNLYCRLDLGRVLMVGTKVSKGFFV